MNFINKSKRSTLIIILIILILILSALVYIIVKSETQDTVNPNMSLSGKTIVIDPGHGGFDGGAVGVSGTYESHVNLSISLKLKAALEAKGATVFMTRTEDVALAESKRADMENRRKMIEESEPDITVSIHQNKHTASSARGPQVFYAKDSKRGEKLAEQIQNAMNADLGIEKPRTQTVGNYFIVKSGEAPSVIIECGFLSNPEEEKLLVKHSYQIAIAKSIEKGIENYFALNLADLIEDLDENDV